MNREAESLKTGAYYKDKTWKWSEARLEGFLEKEGTKYVILINPKTRFFFNVRLDVFERDWKPL